MEFIHYDVKKKFGINRLIALSEEDKGSVPKSKYITSLEKKG
jgi:hypothetical protein